MIILTFSSVTDLFPLEHVKKGKKDANYLGTRPKLRFQKLITLSNLKNQGNHNNVLYTVFHELSGDGIYFFNGQI